MLETLTILDYIYEKSIEGFTDKEDITDEEFEEYNSDASEDEFLETILFG